MEKPKNQHQLTLWYLYNRTSFSLKDLINDSMFFKFQTRLSELEQKFGEIAKRERRKFVNRFNQTSSYNMYSAIDKERILEIYKKIS